MTNYRAEAARIQQEIKDAARIKAASRKAAAQMEEVTFTYLVAGEFRAVDIDEAKRIAEWLFEQEGIVVSIEPIKEGMT